MEKLGYWLCKIKYSFGESEYCLWMKENWAAAKIMKEKLGAISV